MEKEHSMRPTDVFPMSANDAHKPVSASSLSFHAEATLWLSTLLRHDRKFIVAACCVAVAHRLVEAPAPEPKPSAPARENRKVGTRRLGKLPPRAQPNPHRRLRAAAQEEGEAQRKRPAKTARAERAASQDQPPKELRDRTQKSVKLATTSTAASTGATPFIHNHGATGMFERRKRKDATPGSHPRQRCARNYICSHSGEPPPVGNATSVRPSGLTRLEGGWTESPSDRHVKSDGQHMFDSPGRRTPQSSNTTKPPVGPMWFNWPAH